MSHDDPLYARFPDLDPLEQSQWAITWGKRTVYLDWSRDDTHAAIVVTADDDEERLTEDLFREIVSVADAPSFACRATDAAFQWLRDKTGRYSTVGTARARAFIRSVQEGCTL